MNGHEQECTDENVRWSLQEKKGKQFWSLTAQHTVGGRQF